MSDPNPGRINHLRTLKDFEDSLKFDLAGFPPEVRDPGEYGKFLNWAAQAARAELDGYFHWQLANLYTAMQHKRDQYVRQQEEQASSIVSASTDLTSQHASADPALSADELDRLLVQYEEALQATAQSGVPSFLQNEQSYNDFLRVVRMAEQNSIPSFPDTYLINLIELSAENLRNLFLREQEASTLASASSTNASTGETDGSQRTIE